MKFISVLICLTPKPNSSPITEYTFYQLVNPISPVKNIKLINKTVPYKAFVQLESNEAADLVIDKLHSKTLNVGRLRVFISNKTYIALEKTLKQIIEEAQQFENTNTIEKRNNLRNSEHHYSNNILKDQNLQNISHHNRVQSDGHMCTSSCGFNGCLACTPKPTVQQISKNNIFPLSNLLRINKANNSKTKTNCSEIITRGIKKLTADQTSIYVKTAQLDASIASRLVEVANRYGDILSAEFETTKKILFIDFKSKFDAENMIKNLHNSYYAGNKLIVALCESLSNILDASFDDNTYENSQLPVHNLPIVSSKESKPKQIIWSLELVQPPTELVVEDFARIIGKMEMPKTVSEAVNRYSGDRVFVAEFDDRDKAMGVINGLKISKRMDLVKLMTLKPL